MPIPQGRDCYTLNHYYKNVVQQNLGSYFQEALGCTRATHVWQLVPDIFSLDVSTEPADAKMPVGFEVPTGYVWQEHGYWHIGRSQVMFRKYAEREYYNNDMANQLKLNHMDMTFEPSWHCAPGEETQGERSIQPVVPLAERVHGAMVGVDMSEALHPRWLPALTLETMHALVQEPMPVRRSSDACPSVDSMRLLRGLFSSAPACAVPRPDTSSERSSGTPLAHVHTHQTAPRPDTSSERSSGTPLETAHTAAAAGLGAMLAQANRRRKKPSAADGPVPAPA
jgi:hypothetical protein